MKKKWNFKYEPFPISTNKKKAYRFSSIDSDLIAWMWCKFFERLDGLICVSQKNTSVSIQSCHYSFVCLYFFLFSKMPQDPLLTALWFELMSLSIASFFFSKMHIASFMKRKVKHTMQKETKCRVKYHLLSMVLYHLWKIVTGHSRFIYYFNTNTPKKKWWLKCTRKKYTYTPEKKSIIKDHISVFGCCNCSKKKSWPRQSRINIKRYINDRTEKEKKPELWKTGKKINSFCFSFMFFVVFYVNWFLYHISHIAWYRWWIIE